MTANRINIQSRVKMTSLSENKSRDECECLAETLYDSDGNLCHCVIELDGELVVDMLLLSVFIL